ncbi:MAG: DNA repair protein RecO [Hyphomicrobiales bacterium]
MDWGDEGIFLSGRPLGGSSIVAELLTLEHGRHLGSCGAGARGASGPCSNPAIWYASRGARLSEHLGGFNVELMEAHGARALDDARALAAIGSLASLVKLLPERDPHPELYATTLHVLRSFDEPDIWPALLVHWEFQLLQELGFGLDLSECAATGEDRAPAWSMSRRAQGEPCPARRAPLVWRQAAGAAGVPAGRRRALTDADIAAGFALSPASSSSATCSSPTA